MNMTVNDEIDLSAVRYVALAVRNANGTFQKASSEDGFIYTMDYLNAIGMKLVAGHTPFHSIGYNPDLGSTREDICEWGGIYVVPPAGGIQMVVQSTSADDDGSPVGIGVRTVEINYLDTNWLEATTTVVMNGITGVNTTPTDIQRVNYFHTKTAGTSGEAVGNITLKNTAGTVTYAQITATGNFSRHGFFTIPAGKQGYISGAYFGCGNTVSGRFARAKLRTTSDHDGVLTAGIFQYKRPFLTMDASNFLRLDMPILVPAMCDIKISAIDEAGTIVSSFVEGWYE